MNPAATISFMSQLFNWRRLATAGIVGLLLIACTPRYDWREVRGSNAPYSVLLPAKPATLSRPINLDGIQVTMTMTAAEVDGVAFAVASAELADAAAASSALDAMQSGMLNNIGGSVRQQHSSGSGASRSIDLEAGGALPAHAAADTAPLLVARFVSRDRRVYQAIVLGPEKAVSREAVETFFSSFKID